MKDEKMVVIVVSRSDSGAVHVIIAIPLWASNKLTLKTAILHVCLMFGLVVAKAMRQTMRRGFGAGSRRRPCPAITSRTSSTRCWVRSWRAGLALAFGRSQPCQRGAANLRVSGFVVDLLASQTLGTAGLGDTNYSAYQAVPKNFQRRCVIIKQNFQSHPYAFIVVCWQHLPRC